MALALFQAASAQSELAGRHQYPQFRTLSGLPGGGFGVLPSGKPGVAGAAALTTPIGYTLGTGDYALGAFNTGSNLNPFEFDFAGNSREQTNGTGFFMFGLSHKGFRLTSGVTLLSTHGDTAFNFQLSPPNLGKLGVAVGVQDLSGGGGASGTFFSGDKDSSRSLYGVATYEFAQRAYVSLGVGDRRFHGGFGNVSVPITERARAMVEYDGFNFNGGVFYGTGKGLRVGPNDARSELGFFLGLVRGKYATIGATLTL